MGANVDNLILGADFLRHYDLVIDLGHKRLVDTRTNHSVQSIISLSPSPSPSLESFRSPFTMNGNDEKRHKVSCDTLNGQRFQ